MSVRELYAIVNEREKQFFQYCAAQEKALAAAITAVEKTTASAFVSAKEAVTKAEIAAEKRFDAVNEFRGNLKDQQDTFITKTEVKTRLDFLEEKITSLQNRQIATAAKAEGTSRLWGIIVGVVGLVIAALAIYFK